MKNENNEKKRWGRRATLLGWAGIIFQLDFLICIFAFRSKPKDAIELIIIAGVFLFLFAGAAGGFLTVTDFKEMATKFNPLKK